MGLFNHNNFGDIQSHVYLEGTILKVYLEDSGIPAAKWDTADVEYENHKVFLNAPIRYHCQMIGVERTNGAIADGGRGFDVGDKVILMARIGTTPGLGEEYPIVYVVAHRDGVVPCSYNFLLIRMSATELSPHSPPYGTWLNGVYTATNPGSHTHEYITVWDPAKNAKATIYNPVTHLPYSFPVTVEAFKPAFDYYRFIDEELFTLQPQGDAQIQEAGFVPDWRSDLQGKQIRGGLDDNAWWTSYNYYGNPISNLMSGVQIALASDNTGAGNGTFENTVAKMAAGADDIARWKANSPQAFNDDTRTFDVKGSDTTSVMSTADQARLQALQTLVGEMDDLIGPLDETKIARWEELSALVLSGDTLSPAYQAELVTLSDDTDILKYVYYKGIKTDSQAEIKSILTKNSFTPWKVAHDKEGKPLKGNSYHLQYAYGEDEVWVCGKNTYQGLVISACDAKWKFIRMKEIPPVMGIGNPGMDRLASGADFVYHTAGIGKLLTDINFGLAASIMQADDSNIFSWGTLKRINDGGYHRTTHPALKTEGIGSWRMTQRKIPYAETEATFITALNTRSELIDVWSRYDNWMNTINYSSASWQVDRTWWFLSNAQQWRIKATFIDTPIGSMWFNSPIWEVALWYMAGFDIFDGGPVCRRDAPVRTHFTRQCKHSRRVIAQIYIVQRQAVTMWDDPNRTFVVQELNKGIYDHFPPEDIKYVSVQGDGANNVDYNSLTEVQKKALLTDRVYLRSQYPGETGYTPPAALRVNRNEVEIMAACDLYSTLKTTFGQSNPAKQTRNGLLEYEIQKLIAAYYTGEGFGIKDFSEFNIEARIV